MGGILSRLIPCYKIAVIRKARYRARAARKSDRLIEQNHSTLSEDDFETSEDLNTLISGEILPLEDGLTTWKNNEENQNVVTTVDDNPAPSPFVGLPPPPPPPPLPFTSSAKQELPHGLVQKQKMEVPKKLACPRWKDVDVNKMSKNAVWIKQGDREMSIHKDYLVKNLTSKFPQLGRSLSIREPSVNKMDNQLCLKLKIFKNSTKTWDSKEIANHILQCDKKFLTSDILKQLKNLLPKDGANNYLDEPSALFLSPILKIGRISQRIDVLLFRLEHEESIDKSLEQFLKDIAIVRNACSELQGSNSLPKILNLILYIGNVLKSSSDAPLSYGFNISYLTKLKDLKQENKQLSLLDFLVETVSKKFPQCLNIQDEIPSIHDASFVSFTEMTEWLNQQKRGLLDVEREIKEATFAGHDDKLKEVLIPFAKVVAKNITTLEGAKSAMEKEFGDINQYFAHTQEDKEIDQCMEFFGHFRTFQEHFLYAIQKQRIMKQ